MSGTELERPSTAGLIGDALRQVTALFSAEVKLAKVEATEKIVIAVGAVASLIFAAVFVLVALIFLLQGLVGLLEVKAGWSPFAASFAVGGGLAFVAFVAMIVALRALSNLKLAPERTLRQAKGAAGIVKGSAR